MRDEVGETAAVREHFGRNIIEFALENWFLMIEMPGVIFECVILEGPHQDKVYRNSYPFRVTSASLQHEEGFHSVLIQDSFSTPTFLSKIMKMTSLLVQYVLSTWVLNRRNIQS